MTKERLWIKPIKKVRLLSGLKFKPLCFHCRGEAVLSLLDEYGWVHTCQDWGFEVLGLSLKRRS